MPPPTSTSSSPPCHARRRHPFARARRPAAPTLGQQQCGLCNPAHAKFSAESLHRGEGGRGRGWRGT
eukprot:361342-Chlamydomonas_euryale.AAC.2